jgi:hypothetical protein
VKIYNNYSVKFVYYAKGKGVLFNDFRGFFGLMFDEMVSLLMEEAKMSKVHASMFATELMDRIEDKYSSQNLG